MQGCFQLVDVLVDASLVGLLLVHEQAREHEEAAKLIQLFVRSHPLVGLLRSVWQVLEEVKRCLFSQFLRRHLLHPDIDHLWQYFVSRHQHGGQYLTLAHILFPQGDGELVER